MPYAIVQKSLEKPPAEALKQAFRALPSLTDHDAATMANDAFGILVKGLELADAGRLLQALHAQGVEAEMVDHERLPPLPPPRPCRRAEPRAERLVAYDHLSRAHDLDWSQVILLAAGAVRTTEFKHYSQERVIGYAGGRSAYGVGPGMGEPITRTEHKDREEQTVKLLLDVFLSVAPGRYRIEADKFNFAYLGQRLSPKRTANYVALVQDCLSGAADAVLNRGAARMRQQPIATVQYPTKHAFDEESTWLLWRHFASGSAGG